jgi:hypothetical protein
MAAGITDSTAVADSLPSEFIAEIKLVDRYSPVMRGLVRNEDLPEHEGSTWKLNELTRSTIVALSEGEDLATAEQVTDTGMTIVPTRYGGQIVHTKESAAKFSRRGDLARLAGEILREDMLRKEDVDLLTQLDSFSVALGSAGTALTIGHIMAAGAAIRGGGQASGAITSGTQNAPSSSEINGVFTSAQLHPVTKNLAIGRQVLTTSGASQEGPQPGEAANRALREAHVGRLGGVNVYVDDNLGKDASDDAKGGVWAKPAIIQVHFMGGVRIVPDEDKSRETREINVFMNKGIGEYKDAWGREMLFDAAAPTS